MKLKILLIIFICGLAGCKCKKPTLPVQFKREIISLTIDSSEITVEGKYYFKNRTKIPKLMKLFYPFPVDEKHFYPYYIDVKNSNFEYTKDGINFMVRLNPLEEKEDIVKYSQKIADRNAKYILTTTKEWKEPLENAQFIIDLPLAFKPVISYKPDSTIIKDNRMFYYIEKKNLFPDTDLIVSW